MNTTSAVIMNSNTTITTMVTISELDVDPSLFGPNTAGVELGATDEKVLLDLLLVGFSDSSSVALGENDKMVLLDPLVGGSEANSVALEERDKEVILDVLITNSETSNVAHGEIDKENLSALGSVATGGGLGEKDKVVPLELSVGGSEAAGVTPGVKEEEALELLIGVSEISTLVLDNKGMDGLLLMILEEKDEGIIDASWMTVGSLET